MNETVKTRKFDSPEDMIAAAARLLVYHFQMSLKTPHGVVLSGGKTPVPAYNFLAENPVPASDNLHIFFSDERMVPVDSEENNYAGALPMLKALNIPERRINRVNTELPLGDAADRYNAACEKFFENNGRVTLGLLGLGTEGHTASLFSLEDIESAGKRFALGISRYDGPDRVSLTPAFFSHIEMIVFLVTGDHKREIVETFIATPGKLPAGRAVAHAPQVELWVG